MSNTEQEHRQPVRQCAGCGGHFPKSGLVRLVRGADGTAVPDPEFRAQCRGAYLCRNAKCAGIAAKNGRVARQLNCRVTAGMLEAAVKGT